MTMLKIQLLKDLLEECDQIVISAAMIGGISYSMNMLIY